MAKARRFSTTCCGRSCAGDAASVRQSVAALRSNTLRSQPLLYVPLAKGGDPARWLRPACCNRRVRDLLQWLPRLGLLREACQLIEAARLMESANPGRAGAISEFDRLFAAGYEAIVEAVVAVSDDWPRQSTTSRTRPTTIWSNAWSRSPNRCSSSGWPTAARCGCPCWKNCRRQVWQALVAFIERYGRDLFTQRFLNMGNLRAILHQGVDAWLARLEEEPELREEPQLKLLDDLGGKASTRATPSSTSSLVIEAIVENYTEYRDYNSTTTQSDRGDLLYTLLDFLRLRVHYDRVAWHLKPVLIAHSVLVRRGRSGAAEIWRRALAERTGELADTLQKALRRAAQEIRHAAADRHRSAGRAIHPAAGDRPHAGAGQAGHGRNPPGLKGRRRRRHSTFELLEQETES